MGRPVRHRSTTAAAAGLLAVLTAAPTAAAAAPALEEIVVTAQKRPQRSEDLGFALSVLDQRALIGQRIQGLDDISRVVPSLDVFRGNGSNNPTITLRGIGTTNPWVNNNPSAAAHADGVYLPMSAYLTFPIFDLERIEVLKGPQVGLYGRNSTAGAINFVSQRPGAEPSGYVDGSYGSYDALDLRAAIGGPIGGAVQGRLAALLRQGGGYMKRAGTQDSTAGFSRVPGVVPGVPAVEATDDYGDRDVLALRGSVSFALREDLDALISIHFAEDDSEITGSTSVNGDALGLFVPPNDDAHVDYDNVELFNDSQQQGGMLELAWQLGDDYQLISVTGFETLERRYNIGDFVPVRVAEASFDEDLQSFFQELRVDYQPNDDLRWLSGVSYTEDDIDYARTLLAYDLLLGALGTAFDQEDESFAVFTQAEWRFAPAWQLTGSLRYTNEEKRYDGGSFDIDPFGVSAIGVAFPNVVPDGLFDQRSYEDDDVSGRLGLQWEPDDRTLWYVSAARAFKSGGFDGSGITEPASFTPFGAETLWAYEAGAKLRLLEERLFFGGATFFYDYDDQQVLSLQDLGTGIVEAVIQNAASSEIQGVDLELDWLVTASLTFSLEAAWLDSEVTDWQSADPAEVQDRIGNELPGTPQFSLTAGADWEQPLGDRTLGVRLWGTYTDEAFRDIENSAELRSDDYALANLRLSLSDPAGWSVYVFAENLFDEEYVTSRRSLVGMLGEYHGPPRTVGLGLRYQLPQ
jgi:iron complex outermembrane receptor protein